MAANKVEINGETVLDLTADSVTPETVTEGTTAHNAAGEAIQGLLSVIPGMVVYVTSSIGLDGSTYSADKTFSEISAALADGKTIWVILNKTSIYPCCGMIDSIDGELIMFSTASTDQINTLAVSSQDVWTASITRIPNTSTLSNGAIAKQDPAAISTHLVDAVPGTDYMAPVPVTAENNGSVLAVAEGAWGVHPLVSETWTFTLEDGSEVTKTVVTGVDLS